MISIKDTISRLGRSVRMLDSHKNAIKRPTRTTLHKPTITKKIVVKKSEDVEFTGEQLEQFKPLLANFQTKIFRQFLEPLEMENLKIFSDSLPSFDEETAKFNWQQKRELSSPTNILNNFAQDREHFDKMVDLLMSMIPSHLKNINLNNDIIVSHILEEQDRTKYRCSRNTFDEVPPIPKPLTKESFEEYIYLLTHSTFHYRNSSSLTSGIIPDILLYTHKLTNEEFKPYRSVQTYNYLIKFFGYDKNQNSFARQLLLVMNKDGHKPNIHTINNLLKLCEIHSHIRSTTSTYRNIYKYLVLCTTMNIQINLSTITRIYASITNIFLKEIFISKIQAINLPIQKNLLVRIIDDFSLTIRETSELICFIEKDLKYSNWHEDHVMVNKVVYHKATNLQSLRELDPYLKDSKYQLDAFTIQSVLEGLKKNKYIKEEDKIWMMLKIYVYLQAKLQYVPMNGAVRTYQFLIEQVVKWSAEYVEPACNLVRSIVYEATQGLGLPQENINSNLPENYRIFRRLQGQGKLDVLEATIDRFNRLKIKEGEARLPDLAAPLTEEEIENWKILKLNIDEVNDITSYMNTSNTKQNDGFIVTNDDMSKYFRTRTIMINTSRNKMLLNKLHEGFDHYVLRKMIERNIISENENKSVNTNENNDDNK
ncbi:uncharacterized protein RJT21DRAFT_8708 [Scheffersomyces amazonensis]|uniref:uncharacterized protein n=1 Tax=Scheffersomyces amazonensis TaxID=1078765 RepID=UPI00315CCF55